MCTVCREEDPDDAPHGHITSLVCTNVIVVKPSR